MTHWPKELMAFEVYTYYYPFGCIQYIIFVATLSSLKKNEHNESFP